MELFIDALLNGGEMPLRSEDMIAATEIAYAAKKSMQEGVPVKLG